MAYLYLNFLDNLDKGLGDKSYGKKDFFTQSLNEQYETLKRKLGGYAPDTLQKFIEPIFTFRPKNYYVSLPSFDRTMDKSKRGNNVLRNIVIRPESDVCSRKVLPESYDFLVIGDVTFGKITEISVKGIDLIDKQTVKYGEKQIYCSSCCAFQKKSIVVNGQEIMVSDYGDDTELHESALTNDFVNEIATKLFPVPNPDEAIGIFNQWQKYIDFRRYYLGKQSERCEKITDVHVCDAYMITKESYRRNEEAFSEFLLDGIKDFGKGEQIILSKEVTEADRFPLICVAIEKNRKEILSETVGRNGKGKPKFEVNLNRYTREAMGLSPFLPKSDDKGNIRSIKPYLLGERYLFTYIDIEPDLSVLENNYDMDLAAKYSEIESKYNSRILNEVNRKMAEVSVTTHEKYDSQLAQYRTELDDRLDFDVKNGSDKEVIKAYQNKIASLTMPIENKREKSLNSIRANIDRIKKSDLSTTEKDKRINALHDDEAALNVKYEKNIETVKAQVSLRDFYISRNEALIEKKQKSLTIRCQEELEKLKREKESQLQSQHEGNIASEKTEIKNLLSQKLNEDKDCKIENETIRRYQIYFRPENITDKANEIKMQIETLMPNYLTYDNRAEKSKIDRQEKALNSILGGYVKNPFLATYLFAPEKLEPSSQEEIKDPTWCLESLNDRQKLAVKRALQSESIFLLQGPPGTGKTQVIAEITAQLTKRGKKVLISSETHKAIDNVFERLPKIPEIRPLRLIPSQNRKETDYSPERLVDNFYLNICGNLEKQIARFDNYNETREKFDSTMKSLRLDYARLLELQRKNTEAERKRDGLVSEINQLNEERENSNEKLRVAKGETEKYNQTLKYVESYRFSGEGTDSSILDKYAGQIKTLLSRFACFKNVTLEKVSELANADIQEIGRELDCFLSEDKLIELGNRKRALRDILSDLRDPETDDAPAEGDSNYEEYKKKQSELIDVNHKIKDCEGNSKFDISESVIYSLVPDIAESKETLKQLPTELVQFKEKLADSVNEQRKIIESAIDKNKNNEYVISDEINELKSRINQKKIQYEELGENPDIKEYSELNSALKQKITRFFRDFGIVKEYDSDNLETAFDIIKDEWNKLETEYNSSSNENKIKIPMYKDIIKYLSQEDILEEDRAAYTRELYNSANVFGITCTSRDRFTSSQLAELDKYGIKSIDIRTQGIDVVIVDEVSKSSFLDLLIPILYGKTVILVGDHRQLPPMYDLRHMRGDDFDGLDEEKITKEINDGYTKLYEECFFKTLYEKIPADFRVMLNKQYRCHSDIMAVFNHFYGGNSKGLVVGKKQQDDEKEHNLTVKINGKTVIDPKRHIYFVDCDQKESSAFEGSTSKINEQEAQVAITLLKELDKAANELVSEHRIIVDPSHKIDERPSAGIICTYGDQAGLIKKKRKGYQFKGFSGKPDERLVISTVDDFQGDERDIIIVSMVRNPNGTRYDAEFIKKFERINVALSRARKLLIIIGSKKFLSEAGIIDLPDLEGDHSRDKINFHVYKEIINTIDFRGRILTANDILGE